MNTLTCGNYLSEDQGAADFDRRAEVSGCFRVYREVCGFYTQPRLQTAPDKTPRIDRIITPTQKLVDAGWPHGPIGVECKISGKELGKCISQALDYSRAVWQLPRGFNVVLDWIFLWPLDGHAGDIGSIMAQNRIGYAHPGKGRRLLTFGVGGANAIAIDSDGTVSAKRLVMGYKAGNRG